jgi:NADPH:quinone reductase-like Zn-dependent oxidoreductase
VETNRFRPCGRALAPNGTLVLVGAGKGFFGPLGRLAAGAVRSRLLKQRVVVFIASVTKQRLLQLKELIEAGKVTPVIDRTLPLSEMPAAMFLMEREKAQGKVVVTVSAG